MDIDPHDLIPAAQHGRVDPYVQRWVAGTNGNLYVPLINKLPRYPIASWPGPKPSKTGEFLLDIGCAWGRWLVSAGRAGFLPVGIDINPKALHAARRVLRHHHLNGYVVAADLRALPFASDVFDTVFSYSVLQHTHRRRCTACLSEVKRILRPGGTCCFEFPVRHGLTNWRHLLKPSGEEDDYDSWCVRYYSWNQLRSMFAGSFVGVEIECDCYFGIGIRRDDLDILPWKYKPIVVASEVMKSAASVLPPVRWLSDSVFVSGRKVRINSAQLNAAPRATTQFGPEHNLWILPWLACPVSGEALEFDAATHSLLSRGAGLRYPIEEDVPILLEERARPL